MSVEFVAVAQNGESEIIRYLFLRSFNLCRFEFKDLAATSADQMIVVLVFDLVTGYTVVEVTLLGETRVHKELERPVDGGVADMGIAQANSLVEILAGDMPPGFEKSVEDRLPLFRMLEVVRLKESRKRLLLKLVSHRFQFSRLGPLGARRDPQVIARKMPTLMHRAGIW